MEVLKNSMRLAPVCFFLALLVVAFTARAEPGRIVVETTAPLADGVAALLERAQLHYVAVAQGGDNGTVRLRFGTFRHPAVIVLSSWSGVEWRMEGPVPEQVKAILLLPGILPGRLHSIVSNVPRGLPVQVWSDQVTLFPYFIACPSATQRVVMDNCRQPQPLSSPEEFGVGSLEGHLLRR